MTTSSGKARELNFGIQGLAVWKFGFGLEIIAYIWKKMTVSFLKFYAQLCTFMKR